MKNRLTLIVLLIFIFFSFLKIVHSSEFIFETKEINIYDNGNITEASEGIAKSIKQNFLIKAKKFRYDNKLSTLSASNGIATSPDDSLEINADNFKYNEKIFLLEAQGNVLIKDLLNNITVKSQSISFDNKKKKKRQT